MHFPWLLHGISVGTATCLHRGYCCLACRCTELQQALHSLQDVTGVLVDAGRGIVASAGGRQIKRVMRNFAEAHQGSS